jgi:hypothetical protein
MKGQLGFIFKMKMEFELAQVDLQGRLGIFDHFSINQNHLKYLIVSNCYEQFMDTEKKVTVRTMKSISKW